MKKFTYDMNHSISSPIIVLSTKYHKHLGVIENVSKDINGVFTMSSHQEISFDVYKELDGNICSLWDKIVDLKYIYVPDHKEYYEIQVTTDDSNNTIKHVVGVSAGECELSQRYIRDFHCNDETDILSSDYVPTVLYNPLSPRGSLLTRVLKDKAPEWAVDHVDETIASIQRTFTADNTTIYDFLINTVAQELDCLFQFDSVNRTISVYDLKNKCLDCGFRGDFVDGCCPKCGGTNYTEPYGKKTPILISPKNFASQITIDGDADAVKNCFEIRGGDDNITAAVRNINPNGSGYIYRFSDAMYDDMPPELVDLLVEYDTLYKSKQAEYEQLTEQWYNAIDQKYYYQTKMMPETPIPQDTTADLQLQVLMNSNFYAAVQNFNSVTKSTADGSVKGMAKVVTDPRYTVDIIESSFNNTVVYVMIDGVRTACKTWTGKFKVKSLGGVNSDGDPDEASSTENKIVYICGDYEKFLKQKIEKTLDRSDAAFITLFTIEDDNEFKEALKLYALDSLESFSKTYESALEVLMKAEVADKNATVYNVDIYGEIYEPIYNRREYILDEISVRSAEVNAAQAEVDEYNKLRTAIKDELNLQTYLGDDMYKIFMLYLREDQYTNSNYISDNLDNNEIIEKAKELFEVAEQEIIKASELQYTLSSSLVNLLATEEFKDFKDDFEIGDWIMCEGDDHLYRLRLIQVDYNYGTPGEIQFTFSNATRVNGNVVSDVADILSKASTMATSFEYVAHQANQGEEAKEVVTSYKNDGLDSALTNILAGTNQDITIDDHGITIKSFDDISGSYSPKQARIVNNILAFTTDNWKTASLGLGEHEYLYYNKDFESFTTTSDYGLTAKFVNAGYIHGSQIIAGDIYSENYVKGSQGTYINLNDGTLYVGGEHLVYTPENGLTVRGDIIANTLVVNNEATLTTDTYPYITHSFNIVQRSIDDIVVTASSSTQDTKQLVIRGSFGLRVATGTTIDGQLHAQSIYSGDVQATNLYLTGDTSVQGFINAQTDVIVGTKNEAATHRVEVKSRAGFLYMYSEGTTNGNKGIVAYNANRQNTPVLLVNQSNNLRVGNTWWFNTDGSLNGNNITLKNGVITSTSLTVNGNTATRFLFAGDANNNGGIEIYHSYPNIDFHFNRTTRDYTARIIEGQLGVLTISGKDANGNDTGGKLKVGTIEANTVQANTIQTSSGTLRVNTLQATTVQANNLYTKNDLNNRIFQTVHFADGNFNMQLSNARLVFTTGRALYFQEWINGAWTNRWVADFTPIST